MRPTARTADLPAARPSSILSVLLLASALFGCSARQPYVWVHHLPEGEQRPEGTIQPRDTIVVHVRDQPQASGEFVVRPDGGYVQPQAGDVAVAGLTPGAASQVVAEKLRGAFVDPIVTVGVANRGPIRVSVVGEVKTPGVYELTRDRGVLAALAAAGWLTDFAQPGHIYVVRRGNAAGRVRFRLKDLTAAERHSASFRLDDGDAVVAE